MQSFEGANYGSLDAFRLVERPRPDPKPGQVRLRIEATALGFVDSLLIQGLSRPRSTFELACGEGAIAKVLSAAGQACAVDNRIVAFSQLSKLSIIHTAVVRIFFN